MIQIDINMPIGCIYEGDNGKTEYCPLCNHDDVPYCQYLDDNEAALGIDERPCYCPLYKPEPHWIPCSEHPEYDFEDVLIRWHDKRKGCEDDYILCEGYVVRKHWCCIFEDADMSDYEPVEWVSISQRRNNVSEFNQ